MNVFFSFVGLLFALSFSVLFSFPAVPAGSQGNGLSLEQAVGQVIIMGFEGTEVTPEVESLVKEVQPGGVLLLGRNIQDEEQVKKLISDLQGISTIPLFVAIDQEGGLVSRAWWVEDTAQAFLGNSIFAREIGRKRARELRSLGVTMNLAPVLDSKNPEDYVFPRSFQQDDLKAAELAVSLVRSHQEEGVLAVPKHYPGYDGISGNPEDGNIPRTKAFPQSETFTDFFFRFVPPVLMISHVVYEDVDKEYPLPLSGKGIARLKENVGESVLLMTDDLLSKSMTQNYKTEELGGMVMRAGVDILLTAAYPQAEVLQDFYRGLWKEARRNPGLAAKIQTAAFRVLEVKRGFAEQ